MYHSNVAQRSLIHHICRGRRGHCPWSKIVHVEQFCFTWKLLMVKISHHKQTCSTWKLFVMWSNLVMWIYYKLFPVPNFAQCDKFTMYAVLTWFTLFRRKIHFVAIYVLLCGAKMNPFGFLQTNPRLMLGGLDFIDFWRKKVFLWYTLREVIKKHRKNCECCPVSQFIVR